MASPFAKDEFTMSSSDVKVSSKSILANFTQTSASASQEAILPHPDANPSNPAILITSALPYVNNVPHLGNLIGSLLSADVYARYSRTRNRTTLFICGTDEYGTATETKALEDKVTPQELCDKYHAIHKQVYQWFGIGFDHFGRTTTPKQTEIAQDIFLKLYDKGHLEQRSMVQLFCEKDQRFLADRYVEGECPKCGYEDARGDQCDKCGQLLDAIDLIKPRCKLCSTSPISRPSNHMFLRIDQLQPLTEAWARKASIDGAWSLNGIQITESWFKEGLRPFALTRDLKWGVSVPIDGMREKVLYVWFDAPIGYPSITANYTEDWEKWWKNKEGVRLYQFMGKDNVRFHTVIFPSCLLGTEDPWTLLHHISTTEYLQYESGKFSKSRNIGVFGDKAATIGVPPSVWRYYLLSIRPETNDSHFQWQEFVAKNNSELLANLGNFVNRVLSFMKKYDLKLPEIPEGLGLKVGPSPLVEASTKEYSEDFTFEKEKGTDQDFSKLVAHFVKDVNSHLLNYTKEMEAVRLRPGLAAAMALSGRGNAFLVQAGLDNSLFENHRNRCDAVMLLAINLIWVLSAEFFPFMPETSNEICKQLRAPPRSLPEGIPDVPLDSAEQPKPVTVEDSSSSSSGVQIETSASASPAPSTKAVLPPRFSIDLLPGHLIGKASHLFKPIDEKMEDVWRKQFGGETSKKEEEEEEKKKPQLSKSQAAKLAKKKAKESQEAANSAAGGDSKKKRELKEEEKSQELKDLESQMKVLADSVRKSKGEIKEKEKDQGADLDELEKLKSKTQIEIDQLVGMKKQVTELTTKLLALNVGDSAPAS